MTKEELRDWIPKNEFYQSDWKIDHDDFNVEIEMSEAKRHKAPVVFPDIKTLLETMSMISKLTPAMAKLDSLNRQELEIAKEKIKDYKNYSQQEKDYLLNKIYEKEL